MWKAGLTHYEDFARRLLERHQGAQLVGVDVSEPMLDAARKLLPAERADDDDEDAEPD